MLWEWSWEYVSYLILLPFTFTCPLWTLYALKKEWLIWGFYLNAHVNGYLVLGFEKWFGDKVINNKGKNWKKWIVFSWYVKTDM